MIDEILKKIDKEASKFASVNFPPLSHYNSSSTSSSFFKVRSLTKYFAKRFIKSILKKLLPPSLYNLLRSVWRLPFLLPQIQNQLASLESRLSAYEKRFSNLEPRLTKLESLHPEPSSSVYEAEVSYLPSALSTLSSMNISPGKDLEHFYLLFENTFYNSQVVKAKQKLYLPYLKSWREEFFKDSACRILDVGCGRGEFMELLRAEGFEVEGVEVSSLLCEHLSRKGFKVFHQDANSYLCSLSPGAYQAISALQVVEHFSTDYLWEFLKLCHEKLPPHGLLLIETVNPLANTGIGNFFTDLTHIRPIPPHTLAFLLEWIGFTSLKVIYSSPVPPDYHTRFMEKNFQDYAILGIKK